MLVFDRYYSAQHISDIQPDELAELGDIICEPLARGECAILGGETMLSSDQHQPGEMLSELISQLAGIAPGDQRVIASHNRHTGRLDAITFTRDEPTRVFELFYEARGALNNQPRLSLYDSATGELVATLADGDCPPSACGHIARAILALADSLFVAPDSPVTLARASDELPS